jgi:hypothetical protein
MAAHVPGDLCDERVPGAVQLGVIPELWTKEDPEKWLMAVTDFPLASRNSTGLTGLRMGVINPA